jgi:arsenate reductase-like glutaredoxin family protein
MMLEVPYLIRRPIIRVAGETIFGFDRKRLEVVLSIPPN